ncbi:hypothetical protein Ddye_025899 [Dipteronia dyeriana]|uniref:Uncharacterized protein n=1 Tax=Dipteronia dyeriana TaxID=168575 RepID=A0AAD9TM29_9ROSI|nr:hypothetical protein Ddye_025899 [Dipteronia dyeriana]
MVTDLCPRMLKWKLMKQPRGKKLDKIFSARDDRVHFHTIPDPTTSAVCPDEKGGGPTTTGGPDFSGMDTGGSSSSPRRVRRRKVWFTTPGNGTNTGDSSAGVALDREAHLSPQSEQQAPPLPPNEEMAPSPPTLKQQAPHSPPSMTEQQAPPPPPSTNKQQALPPPPPPPPPPSKEPAPHPSQREEQACPPPPLEQPSPYPSQSEEQASPPPPPLEQQAPPPPSSSQHTPAGGVQQQRCVLKPEWQLLSPYTDPYRPKKARVILEGPENVFNPQGLVDGDKLKAYRAFKKNVNGELRDVDLLTPVDATWFHRLKTNFIDVDNESFLEHQYRNMMPRDSRGQITLRRWNLLRSLWKDDDLTTMLGGAPNGCRPWHEVDMSTPGDRRSQLISGSSRGNCGPHTLRLIEYLLENIKDFDWSEDDIGII